MSYQITGRHVTEASDIQEETLLPLSRLSEPLKRLRIPLCVIYTPFAFSVVIFSERLMQCSAIRASVIVSAYLEI
jgi:hypothetical protein